MSWYEGGEVVFYIATFCLALVNIIVLETGERTVGSS